MLFLLLFICLFINERVGSRRRCFYLFSFVLLLRLMLNFVCCKTLGRVWWWWWMGLCCSYSNTSEWWMIRLYIFF